MVDTLQLTEGDLVNVLECRYKGTEQDDEPLRSNTRVQFAWTIPDMGAHTNTVFACKVLHVPMRTPYAAKLPLLAKCLPVAIQKHKLVPAMKRHDGAECSAIGLPKHFGDAVETVMREWDAITIRIPDISAAVFSVPQY